MKFVFLIICLLSQNFSYASSPIRYEIVEQEGSETIIYYTIASPTFSRIIDSGLNGLELVESKIPKPIKYVGNIGINFYSSTLKPLQQFFFMIPEVKIINTLSNPITDVLVETKFVQEKIIPKIDENIQEFVKNAKEDENFKDILTKNPKLKEFMDKHEEIAKDTGRTIIFVPTSIIIAMLLNKIWHHARPHVLRTLSKNNVKNGNNLIIILETIMTSRLCFLPIQLHKQKHAMYNLYLGLFST